jgi:hypothetical protein
MEVRCTDTNRASVGPHCHCHCHCHCHRQPSFRAGARALSAHLRRFAEGERLRELGQPKRSRSAQEKARHEREVTSECIRDKISASKRKGLWVGGMAPLGYDTKDRKITVNEAEAACVRAIFRSYLKLGSLNLLMADLRALRPLPNSRSMQSPAAQDADSQSHSLGVAHRVCWHVSEA